MMTNLKMNTISFLNFPFVIKYLFLFFSHLPYIFFSFFFLSASTLGLYSNHIIKIRENSKIQKKLYELLHSDEVDEIKKKNQNLKSNKVSKKNGQTEFNKTKIINIDDSNDDNNKFLILPLHIFLDNDFNFYIPIDRALRVVSAIFKSVGINSEVQKVYFTQLEIHAHVLDKSGIQICTYACA